MRIIMINQYISPQIEKNVYIYMNILHNNNNVINSVYG